MDSKLQEHDQGLTTAQVEERIRKGQVNGSEEVKTKSIGQILRTNIITPFNILNIALALCVFLVRSPKNGLFMGVIFCNVFIGTIQEVRAKRLIDRLSLIAAPKAHVIRNGQMREIAVCNLVLDDRMSLHSGNQVCADAVIMEGECEVNEALITGESDPVVKYKGDHLMSGSFLVAGNCLARVEHVGADNYAARITDRAKYLKRPNSEIMDGINRIVKGIGVIVLPVGIALFINQYGSLDISIQGAVISTVAALVGMIPEGLVLLTSVVLAVGVMRLGRRNALVQELYSIETLARVDVLCLDKTGTITEGTMQVDGIQPLPGTTEEHLRQAMSALVYALQEDNPTGKALRQYCSQDNSAHWKASVTIPFSSARKWNGALFPGKGSYVMGAGEFVLGGRFAEIRSLVAEASAKGQRILVLAASPEPFQGQALPAGLVPLGIVRISDKIRKSAKDTLQYFADQGVELKVISGDNAITVASIAKKAGMKNADRWVDATSLKTEEDVRQAAGQYTVFGRVTPEQKLQLVKALKGQGHTVAMTGDGVNDVMALKESDCSIAMASGSDAARNVSQIVLLDSDFASMPYIVGEGRRSINNLQRSASLFLTKTIFSTIIAILFIFVSAGYPLEPIQFTLISACTIGIPSFILALEPNSERIQGHFMINIIKKSIPGAMTNVTSIILLILVAIRFQLAAEEVSTMAAIIIGYTGLLILFKVCIPFNFVHMLLFGGMCAAFSLAVLFLGNVFSLVPLTLRLVEFLVPLMGVATGVLLTFLLLMEKVLIRKGKM